ncbi:MAG: hypothetical protein HY324_03040, partial [Chlamydiia bacterium]|nr:hypothetical protein [Chlamydiia bacterium]
VGKGGEQAFGFASCERLPGAAEGMLVLMEEGGRRRLSNIEYTEIKREGIEHASHPANTNILYANLRKITPVIQENPLPGLLLNMKNKEPYICPKGQYREVRGGRLESMMQNMSDALSSPIETPLSTFLTYNLRKKTISTAKKSYEEGKSLLETPEGAFYDLLYNAHDLLKNHCQGNLSDFSSEVDYLRQGPSHLFLYHPALGPLYSLIAQKIRAPTLKEGSELQLEIADLLLDHLTLEGSLLIFAKNVLGHDSQGIIRYSQRTGKCILNNVHVINRGIHRKATTPYWKNQIRRHESLKIILQGHSELYAEGVTFLRDQTLVVPHGERWVLTQGADGILHQR